MAAMALMAILPPHVAEITITTNLLRKMKPTGWTYTAFRGRMKTVADTPKASSKSNFDMDSLLIKINALVREIKETEAMIQLHRNKQNAVDVLMLQQFQQRQQSLAKELLVLLLQSGLSLKNVEPTIASILAYLRQFDKDELISNSLREHLSEATRALMR